MNQRGALQGVRVLDAGQVIAGPFTATLLGEFGADVIKVEQPGIGDQHRGPDGMALEFAQNSRNKRSVTLDLRKPEGQRLFRLLVAASDVVVENFLPGTMERWNLGYEQLAAVNPGLVMLRLSGFGQSGPYSTRYSFDRVAMAFAGLTYVTGYPDSPPVRPGFFVADYGSGMLAAFGIMAAIYDRDHHGGRGQMVDVSLYETVLRMSGTIAAQYARKGEVRERQGNTFPGISPADQFITSDGEYIVIHAGADRVYQRLCATIGRPDLAADPRFATRPSRAEHMDELHAQIGAWIAERTLAGALRELEDGGVPATGVNSIAHIAADPHVTARDMLLRVPDQVHGELTEPGITPKLSATPGRIERPAPLLGQHNEEIYGDLLGLSAAALAALREQQVI